MKIHINYSFRSGAWGGGNQFLTLLKSYWEKQKIYAANPAEADSILYNSFQDIRSVIRLYRTYPKKIFIHRIDGPVSKIRGHNPYIDKLIFHLAANLADGVVFQSQKCLKGSIEMGYVKTGRETVIHNAVDKSIFYRAIDKDRGKPVRIIATSWSPNPRKGFDIYSHLDENLDFNKYQFTYIGNAPIIFKNIRHINPIPSIEIAPYLRDADIFLSASRLEGCSNSVLEALSCRLPVLYRIGSGNEEIVKDAGLSFSNGPEAIDAIEKLLPDYDQFCSKIDVSTTKSVIDQYYSFIKEIENKKPAISSKLGLTFFLKFWWFYLAYKLVDRAISLRFRG